MLQQISEVTQTEGNTEFQTTVLKATSL